MLGRKGDEARKLNRNCVSHPTNRRVLWKRRWLELATGRTVHSRPPDDAASVWLCTLVVIIELWAWLDGPGVIRSESVLGEQDWRPSRRTVQRWLSRALAAPMAFQQAIRRELIERNEPRPVELLFPSGLPPPERLSRRCWSNRPGVERLWRGIAMVLGGALELDLAVPVLLAEARGRLPIPKPSYMI